MMKIVFFGHACFRILARPETSDTASQKETVAVLTDPYPRAIGLSTAGMEADIVLVSHDHEYHSAVDSVRSEPFVVRGSGEYEVRGISIEGFPGYHDNKKGAEHGTVTLYRLEAEGLRVAFLAGIGQRELSDEQVEQLGEVDIVLLPVGGMRTIGPKEALGIINQIEPRMVIPMQYALPGVREKLGTVEAFLKEMGDAAERLESVTISPSKLPQDEMKIVVLEAKGEKQP